MGEVKHTPLPWVAEIQSGTIFIGPFDRVAKQVAAVAVALDASPNHIENSRLIVAACNAYYGNQAEVERLRNALEPFAEVASRFDGVPVSATLPQQCWFTPHSLREARAALAGGSDA